MSTPIKLRPTVQRGAPSVVAISYIAFVPPAFVICIRELLYAPTTTLPLTSNAAPGVGVLIPTLPPNQPLPLTFNNPLTLAPPNTCNEPVAVVPSVPTAFVVTPITCVPPL